MNLSDWKQAAQRSAATEKLQLVIAQRSTAQRSAAQRSVCVNGPLGVPGARDALYKSTSLPFFTFTLHRTGNKGLKTTSNMRPNTK